MSSFIDELKMITTLKKWKTLVFVLDGEDWKLPFTRDDRFMLRDDYILVYEIVRDGSRELHKDFLIPYSKIKYVYTCTEHETEENEDD